MLLIFSQLFLTPKMAGIVRKRSVNFPRLFPLPRMRIMNTFYTIPGKAILTLRRNLITGINSRLSIYLNIYYLYYT